jgi:hypothetical protein
MTGLAIVYGIAHDLVTAHVAIAYFTVYHPRLVSSTSPVVMALLWGVLATWWVGIPAGVVIGLCNVAGGAPSEDWKDTRRRTALGVVILWLLAMAVLAGVSTFINQAPIQERRPTFESDRWLMSVAVTHAFSYFGAVAMTIIVAALTWRARRRQSRRH